MFADYDLLVCPTLTAMQVKNGTDGNTLGPAEVNGVEIDRCIGWCPTYVSNYSGHPSASIPAGFADGLPVGMQIMGRRYADADVLAASAAFERVRPWHDSYARCAERSLARSASTRSRPADDRDGIPRVLAAREVLDARDPADLLERARLRGRAGGYGTVAAFPGGRVAVVEQTAERAELVAGAEEHTNHYLHPELAVLGDARERDQPQPPRASPAAARRAASRARGRPT